MPFTAVIVRKFDPKDQQNVAEMYRTGVNDYSDTVIGPSINWYMNDKLKPDGDMRNIEKYFMDQDKSCFFVAEFDNKIVGCVAVVPTTKYASDYAEIKRMFVSPTCRGMGVGSKLLDGLEAWAKEVGYKHINLGTLEKQNLALSLYTRNGYILAESEQVDTAEDLQLSESVFVERVHFVKALV